MVCEKLVLMELKAVSAQLMRAIGIVPLYLQVPITQFSLVSRVSSNPFNDRIQIKSVIVGVGSGLRLSEVFVTTYKSFGAKKITSY